MGQHCFYRVQSYGLKSPGKKRTISDIIGEALRQPSKVSHVAFPQLPTILYGEDLDKTRWVVCRLIKNHINAGGRKPLPHAQLMLGAIASYPIRNDKMTGEEHQSYLYWRSLTMKFAHWEYGDQLRGVIEHADESHPHLHIWILAKSHGSRLALGNAHPGQEAERGKAPLDRKPAYKAAMSSLQDRYYAMVGFFMGWDRLSPDPEKRLNYKLWQVKNKKDGNALRAFHEQLQRERRHGDEDEEGTGDEVQPVRADSDPSRQVRPAEALRHRIPSPRPRW